MYMEWYRAGDALYSNANGREYIIVRRDAKNTVSYLAHCDLRGGYFAKRERIKKGDVEARNNAVEELKQACMKDAEDGGLGRQNWGVDD